ncbi:MAG TPA: ABC transporter ATP-binding protein [bacterium]|nr:ABC transporter ATP-binding protein [bacterium]
MSAAAIEVRALRKSFTGPRPLREVLRAPFRRRRVQAIDGLDLACAFGEMMALVGPNGAGKTTLLKILCTLVAADQGSVQIAGIDAARDSLGTRRAVGLVTADERSFYWRLSGRQNLEFFAALHGLDGARAGARIDELLARVALADAAGSPFREYSTGMRQKLALCRGMLHRPRVLLLDEPTRGIDLATLRVLRELLREHVTAGGAALLASHDLAEIEALDCRVALLARGRVTAQGTIAELKRDLKVAERVELLLEGGAGAAAAWAAKLGGDPRVARATVEGELLVLTLAPSAAIGDVVARVHADGGRVLRARPHGAALEAVLDAETAK